MNCKKRWLIKATPLTAVGPAGPQGPPGENGDGIELPLSSDDVTYNGLSLTDVLDSILYQELVINLFTTATSLFEKGQVLTSLPVSWTYNKAVQSQVITGTGIVSPTLALGDRTKTLTLSSVSNNTSVILTADDVTGDGHSAKIATIPLTFVNKVYYGIASIPGAINSAFALGLANNVLQSNRLKSFTANTGINQYIWYITPAAYGVPSFKTNGFNGGFSLQSTFNLTNASGHTESYYVYRSDNENLGLTQVDVL